MLSELHKYAVGHKLAARPGFKNKKLKAYVSLASDGSFIAVDPALEESYCPDLGSAPLGGLICNVPVEKSDVILDPGHKKHGIYISSMREFGEFAPAFAVCADAIENEQTRERILAGLESAKVKPGQIIGFKVDGIPLENMTGQYGEFWESFRKRYAKEGAGGETRCLITGELAGAVTTATKINGLFAVGGHSSGDALICFDKNAFKSYGLRQAANASVSESAITAVNAALGELIADAPILAGAKWVHWYDAEIPKEADIYAAIAPVRRAKADEAPDEPGNEQTSVLRYIAAADALIKSARNGEYPELLGARYHILGLSGVNGRVMIRAYTQGSYEELYENICKWYDDLRIITPRGNGTTLPPKLFVINSRLLGIKIRDISKLHERINNELPGIEVQLMSSITGGLPLPDTVAARALQYIRGELQSADSGDYGESVAYQLLKAWLIRKQRNRGGEITMSETVNENNRSVAYLAGRMMAVYARIQEAALGDVGAGVVERYYTSASTSPALVLGRLSDLSQHHLSKMEKGLAVFYSKMLVAIAEKISESIPKTLSLEQKTEFALGYYQQLAIIYQRNKEDK